MGSESSDVHRLASDSLPPGRYRRVDVGDVDGLVHVLHDLESEVVAARERDAERRDRLVDIESRQQVTPASAQLGRAI